MNFVDENRDATRVGGFNEAWRASVFIPGVAAMINYHAVFENG